MPHLYPAETITYMKRKGMKLPLTVAVMTDYTCIPFWEETDCDYYMIPHESLIPEIVKRGIPEEKLVVTGIPVAAAVIMCQAVVIPMAVAEDTVRQESRSLTGFSGLVRG